MLIITPSILQLLIFQLFQPAAIADAVMAADYPAALRAFPLLFLIFQELFYPEILDIVEVLNHAHVVFFPVALIQLLEMFAWILFTFETIFYTSFSKKGTMLFHEGAIFTARAAARAVSLHGPGFLKVIFLRHVITA